MVDRSLSVGGYAGLLLSTTGVVAWVAGSPFVFPSLGPTAFVLATASVGDRSDPSARSVLAGHAVGVVAGLVAYHALVPGVAVTDGFDPLSPLLLRLVVAAVVALVLTSVGMLALDAVHPPACATTLIVSLGLLARPRDGVVIMVAVALLYGAHRALTVWPGPSGETG